MNGNSTSRQVAKSFCGNGKCEGPETINNCRQDCDPNSKTSAGKLPGMIFGFGFLGSMLLLGLFTALRKLKFLENQKKILMQFNASELSFLKLTGKKVTLLLIALAIMFLTLTIIAVLFNRNPDPMLLKQTEQARPEPGKAIMNQEQKPVLNSDKQGSGICGNNICEPGLGESKEICPKDCSAGN